MDERIIEFIKAQKVASIACVDQQGNPYCFSCFFAFDDKKNLLYFKSSASAHHSQLLIQFASVAGTINPDKLNTLAIKGIQFTGVLLDKEDILCKHAGSAYHMEYPFALAMPGVVWTIQLLSVKYTDNTLGFGKKLTWEMEHELIG